MTEAMKSKYRYIQLPVLLLGAALFVYMLGRTGIGTILDKGRLLGSSFFFLILLSGARHGLRALAWYGCVGRSERRPSLRELFEMRLVGEAINGMTPAGPLLGETVKVWAVSRTLSTKSSVSSVVIENLIYGLSAALFMLSGLVLLLLEVETSLRVRLIVGGLMMTILFISVVVPYRIVSRRSLLLSGILDRLREHGSNWAFLERYGESIRAYEENIHDAFSAGGNFFFYIFLIEMVTNLTGIGEAYLILTGNHGARFNPGRLSCRVDQPRRSTHLCVHSFWFGR